MILDAFTFLNEYDMLEFRLKLLWEKIDKFIIVESDHTFSGKEKPWNFLDNIDRFSWAGHKIIYYQHKAQSVWDGLNPPTHTDPSHPCWNIEYAQRDAIVDACKAYSDDDILLMGDCDEIPSDCVFDKMDNIMKWEPVALRQKMFYYNLSCLRREEWNGTIISRLGTARSQGTQALRGQRNTLPVFLDGGWHLSYFMNAEGIQEKLHSFSHVEYDTPKFNNENHIKSCISERKDLFVRGMQADKIGKEYFPEYFLRESDNFNWWGEYEEGR